ncbi:MAG: hypothetical protein RMK29_13060 [Myxococcales bacterium]|nr:hypothetical protein [Myxococcota bacterium]MDW8282635.1 hypothetical protein [Myxococcales bacterium]
MKPKDFEHAVLELAMTTRVPLTRANIAYYTGVGSQKADRWLDSLVRDGVLDFDSDDEGEIVYSVRGASRPQNAPAELRRCSACGRPTAAGTRCTRCGQLLDDRLRALRQEVDAATTALTLLHRPAEMLQPTRKGSKSLVVAGLLGLFFGPLGWFYAAPLREAGPAATAFLLVSWLLPIYLFLPFVPLLPISAVVGMLYAWKYNRTGRRSGLLTEEDSGLWPGGLDGPR